MDRYGVRAATFCEHCGIHRDQLGDESIMPFRECATCGQAVCPNCWNIVADACLKCVPFMLPDVAAPTDPRVVATVVEDEGLAAAAITRTAALPKAALAPPLPVMGGTVADGPGATSAPTEPDTKKKGGRRLKTPAVLGAAAGTAKAKAAKTIAPVAVVPPTTPPIAMAPATPAPAPAVPAAATPTAAAAPAAAAPTAAAPTARTKGQAKRPKLPALPTPKRSAAGAAAAAAAPREVQWPDRSVDWQIRPGQPMPTAAAAQAADRPRPAAPAPAPSTSRGPAPTAARAGTGRPARSRRVASLVGFLVVAVAMFGVAGISLAALGRLPMGHRAVATIVPEPDTQAPATPTDVLGTFPPLATPGVDGKVPRQVSGHSTGGGGGGGNGGGGGSGSTPRPDETVSTGGAGFGATPKPTATPTAAPTPTPTPDPTPTPTPDPTPTPRQIPRRPLTRPRRPTRPDRALILSGPDRIGRVRSTRCRTPTSWRSVR